MSINKENTYIYNLEELSTLKLNNIKVDGMGLTLEEGHSEGSVLSDEISTKEFINLVPSWNAHVKPESSIEVLVAVNVDGVYSEFLSTGPWNEKVRFSIDGQRDEIATMNIDTVSILNGKSAKGFKFKVVFKGKKDDVFLNRCAFTLKYKDKPFLKNDLKYPEYMDIDVPKREQMTVPEVGNIICSPTSLSMVLQYYGENHETIKIADLAKDQGANIYGNWPYTAAVAPMFRLKSYVQRLHDLSEAKEFIHKGIPLVASIGVDNIEDLKGVESTYPDGHLLVIRGFKIVDGKEYVIVNDPATKNMDNIYREYDYVEFEKAFSGIVYVIEK